MSLRCLLPCLALCAAQPALSQIYAGRTAAGTVVLSNHPGDPASELLIAAETPAEPPRAAPNNDRAVPTAQLASQPQHWDTLIREVATTTALSPALLHAVIAVESGYRVRAVSHKGAQGLMQLLPATARRFGATDPFDPRQNVTAGATYLKWLLTKFDGDLALALAAYNAGEQAVIRAGYRIPPFDETRAYVPRVLARLQRDRSS